ncbi:hypothetical protein ColKHC_03604 [Colletotrichum higginsianum]|nr:hypothetical protein ColKHC_03604 [Colletotrichum higginsianum]
MGLWAAAPLEVDPDVALDGDGVDCREEDVVPQLFGEASEGVEPGPRRLDGSGRDNVGPPLAVALVDGDLEVVLKLGLAFFPGVQLIFVRDGSFRWDELGHRESRPGAWLAGFPLPPWVD